MIPSPIIKQATASKQAASETTSATGSLMIPSPIIKQATASKTGGERNEGRSRTKVVALKALLEFLENLAQSGVNETL